MICRYRPNVYLDISGYQIAFSWDPEGAQVRKSLSQGINHKLLFGTDWPVFLLQGEQGAFVKALTNEDGFLSDLSDQEKAFVLHQNIDRLLSGSEKVEWEKMVRSAA